MPDNPHMAIPKRASLDSIAPFFVVDDIQSSVHFYLEKLGFALRLLVPEGEPFFAIVRRGPVEVILKEISPDVHPTPNHARHEWARWDALIYTREPDALFEEFRAVGLTFHAPLADTDDGLRAFEIKDNSGYVLCFACPLDQGPA